MTPREQKALQSLINHWQENESTARAVFLKIIRCLESRPDIRLSFVARPGVSYSLRAARPGHVRNLFVLVDVIDDDPANRWLSVCFYDDMISDPEKRGNQIPGGLLGEDGYCFDIDQTEEDLPDYVITRIDEAHRSAVDPS